MTDTGETEAGLAQLRALLEQRLRDIDGVTVAPWKGTALISVQFNGREFAHFHGQDILDIRLSQPIIRQEGLSRDVSNEIHPNRSQTSRWIGIRFAERADIDRVLDLAKCAREVL